MAREDDSLRSTARLASRGAAAVASTAVAGIGAPIHRRLVSSARWPAVLAEYRQAWADRMLWAGGAEVELVGPAPAPANGPRLVVSNHRSMLDTPVLLSLFGGHFLSLAELAGMPVIGAAAKASGVVFVDRQNPSSRTQAIRAVRRLLDGGATVIVFPEGTTFLGDEVRPFQPGVFLVGEGVELLPVGLAYDHPSAEYGDETLAEHASRIAKRPKTRVTVAIGAPIPLGPSGRGAPERRAIQAQAAIQALVHTARAANPRLPPPSLQR
ncbi:MAG: lysophospholipid acyltransferase family protein [Myxococcota bacterium]